VRKICVITGYRSDYTKLKSVLRSIKSHSDLQLQVVAFGAHLLGDFGNSVNDIVDDGFEISYKCNTTIAGDSPLVMSKSVGFAIVELTAALEQLTPDVVLIVGDRYEILAAAVAASIGNIPVAHIQGGEISGTIDETIRHAITKLSHIHFPSTELSKQRILKMGECPSYVFNVGCPAVDYISDLDNCCTKSQLSTLKGLGRTKLNKGERYFLLIQHPVTTEFEEAGDQMALTLEALQSVGIPTLLIYPNPDAGSAAMVRSIRRHSQKYKKQNIIKGSFKNLPFKTYLNLLRYSEGLVGNSSSGIREACMYNVPAINIGSRQNGRERTANIVDVPHDLEQIKGQLSMSLQKRDKGYISNDCIYGDGTAGRKIADILSTISLDSIEQKSLQI
jgi:UDP-N-acetylglucosamine 2-epimerase (non-hydrolysing)/GDP/UDP-N,N'-diacetylbacillosamine 2-epimerase (hydrolysing)